MPEIELFEILAYLTTGAAAGLLAGLLGVGGGLFIVPVLLFVLPRVGIDTPHLMTICIATSLGTIVITSLSSAIAHHKHQAILWPIFRQLLPGIVVGALLGAYVADWVSEQVLTYLFAVSVILIALRMLFKFKTSSQTSKQAKLPGLLGLAITGSFIGSLSTMIGIGGGSLCVPILKYWQTPMAKAVATSAACGLPIAIAGTVGFIFVGYDQPNLPAYSSGYVYWPAVLGIVSSSVLFAPIGAKMTHKISALLLSQLFGLFLLIVGLKVLFT